jgi:transcriptional regulator with XRE-family HTH domain
VGRAGETELSGIGPRLRGARERLGWSREELAVHSELSWSAITQVESGRRRNVRPHTLSALAGALGVTVDYLVHGAPPSSTMLEHRALFYATDEEFVDVGAAFIREGIERSEAVFVPLKSSNIALLRERLGSEAEAVEFVEAESWYAEPGSAIAAYQAFVKAKVDAGAPWVRILGELLWSGKSESEIDRWTRYESLFNLVFAASPVTVVCLYDTRSVPAEIARMALSTHPHTIGQAGVASSSDYADPARFVLGT